MSTNKSSSKQSAPALIHVPHLFSIVEPGVYRCASPTAAQVGLATCCIEQSLRLGGISGAAESQDDHIVDAGTSHSTFVDICPVGKYRFCEFALRSIGTTGAGRPIAPGVMRSSRLTIAAPRRDAVEARYGLEAYPRRNGKGRPGDPPGRTKSSRAAH